MHQIAIQLTVEKALSPKKSLIKKWASTALDSKIKAAEITVRIVNEEEMAKLNATYRHKLGPTNVLSFPFSLAEEIELEPTLLGDIVICAEVVNREAKEQQKTKDAHWAHMVVHGVFHLLGYDHENERDAEKMENLEIKTLEALGFKNPYE